MLQDSKIVAEPTSFYNNLSQLGLNYGPFFQTVTELRQRQDGEIIAKIEIEPSLAHDLEKYFLHPTMLDGCLQSLMAMLDSSGTTFLPTNVGELRFFNPDDRAPEQIWCIGQMVEQTSRALICDMTLLNEKGEIIGAISGLTATAASRSDQRLDQYGEPCKLQILTYHWDYGETPAEPSRLGHWLVIGDGDDSSEFVASRMESFGAMVRGKVQFGDSFAQSGNEFTVQPYEVEDAKQVIESVGELNGVVFFNSLDQELNTDCPTGQNALSAMITFTQAMLEIPVSKRPRVYVVTQGGFSIDDFECDINPASATLNGWTRVACNELSGFRFSSVDLSDPEDEMELDALTLELICDTPEDEVAIRGDLRFVSELRETGVLTDDIVEPTFLTDENPIKVRPLGNADSVGTVRILEAPMEVALKDEIVVRIEKSLLPTNLLQDQSSEDIDQSQIEFTGTVVSVGSEVDDLAAGDRVCGFAPSELASHARGKRDEFFLAPIPEGCEFITGRCQLENDDGSQTGIG